MCLCIIPSAISVFTESKVKSCGRVKKKIVNRSPPHTTPPPRLPNQHAISTFLSTQKDSYSSLFFFFCFFSFMIIFFIKSGSTVGYSYLSHLYIYVNNLVQNTKTNNRSIFYYSIAQISSIPNHNYNQQ